MSCPVTFRKIKLTFLTLCLGLTLTATAQADPLTFSNAAVVLSDGTTRVDLFSNSSVLPIGPQLNFLVDLAGMLPAAGSDTLQITFTQQGYAPQQITFQIPLFAAFPPPYTQPFSFNLQDFQTPFTVVTLRIDILGSATDFVIPGGPGAGSVVDSYTYTLSVAQPVPEPSTILLAGLGLAGAVARRYRWPRGHGSKRSL
jgi:hypothetical protein